MDLFKSQMNWPLSSIFKSQTIKIETAVDEPSHRPPKIVLSAQPKTRRYIMFWMDYAKLTRLRNDLVTIGNCYGCRGVVLRSCRWSREAKLLPALELVNLLTEVMYSRGNKRMIKDAALRLSYGN